MQAPFADPLTGIELYVQQLPLVGRETEMRAIRSLLDTVAQGLPAGPRALMISGDVGTGKSRLLAEMCEEAEKRDFRVLGGRAYEAGVMFPYLPFIEALRPFLRADAAQALRVLLGLDQLEPANSRLQAGKSAVDASTGISLSGAPLVTALARLFPELLHLLPVANTPEPLAPDQEKFRLFDAVATLLERMAAERPVMFSIDNLQWADSASLELTLYLTVRLHSSRVALVGVTRPAPSQSASNAGGDKIESERQAATAIRALSELMLQGLLLYLPIQPLSVEWAGQHLQALLPGAISGAATLLARAGGNPFFLEELVRMLTLDGQLVQRNGVWDVSRAARTELPLSIFLAVEQRLRVLSSACLELLRAAALFGRTFPLQALLMAMEEGEARVQACIDEAQQALIIANAAHGAPYARYETAYELADYDSAYQGAPSSIYLFCQGIVQEVLSSQVPARLASRLHGKIGAALEAYYGGQAPAGELARHYVLSGERQAALRWSLRAGEDAARQQAHREAIAHFRAMLTLMGRYAPEAGEEALPLLAQVHGMIGESWFRIGELDQAARAFQQALEELRRETASTVPALLTAQVNRMLADVYRMQGKYELTLAHLQAARSALDAEIVERGERVTGEEGRHYAWMTSRSYAGRINQPEMRTPGAERVLLLQAQATMDLLLSRAAEAEQALWQSYQLATELGDRASQAFALHLVGWIRGWGERIHEAIRLQEQAHELYVAIGDPFRAALGDQGLGIIYTALGEIEKARLHNLRGFELARRYGVRQVLGWLHWNQAVMELGEGKWAECDARLQQSMQEAEATGNARLKPVIMQVQAVLSFRKGEWQRAEQLFQASLAAAGNTEWYPGSLAMYAHFLAVTGRIAQAKAYLEQAAALQEPVGYSGHYYIPFLAQGFLHIGAPEQAGSYIKRMQKLSGFMYYGVAVDRIRGEVAALNGDWDEAEQAFDDGLELCRRIRNQPEEAAILYEQARTTLLRAGKQGIPARRSLESVQRLCQAAREIFVIYDMLRAVSMVDTLHEGLRQLAAHARPEVPRIIVEGHLTHAGYPLDPRLTKRELDVLRLVAEGHTDREVAGALVISPRTVHRHLSNIFVKLDVPGRAAAVAYALRQGLVC